MLTQVIDHPPEPGAVPTGPEDQEDEEEAENQDEYMQDIHQRMYENEDHPQHADEPAPAEEEEDPWEVFQDSDAEEVAVQDQKIKRLKNFNHRPEWLWLQEMDLANLPTHIPGCSIGVHVTRNQWQGYYGGHSCGMSCVWNDKISPKRALLTAVVGVLKAHVAACSDKMWKKHLARAEEQLSKTS